MRHGNALYRTEQIRLCEQMASEQLGLTGEQLMARAGAAAFSALRRLYPATKKIAVFCGAGNNAGDGYVLACLAAQAGYVVMIYQAVAIEKLPAAAKQAAIRAQAMNIPFFSLHDALASEVELIVDALLGIGISGVVRPPIAKTINRINASGLPIVSLDVPSGLDADTGRILGVCVQASVCITFIAAKLGLYLLDGADYAGKIICDSLQLTDCLEKQIPAACLLQSLPLKTWLPPRRRNSHKGEYGHVLVVGGGEGMPGAAYLAALAALRVGAGSVTVATRPKHVSGILPGLPEAMVYGVEAAHALLPLLEKATVCVIGPGLGQSPWAEALFQQVMAAKRPLVVDASALHLLATYPQQHPNWILTPHPGEAAKLLACHVTDIQQDRVAALKSLHARYGGVIVLKGHGTLIHSGEEPMAICTEGNPGMASAGMGDVLSGVMAGLLAQGVSLARAAQLGVYLHAVAADAAIVNQGQRGLMASDLMPWLRVQLHLLSGDGHGHSVS